MASGSDANATKASINLASSRVGRDFTGAAVVWAGGDWVALAVLGLLSVSACGDSPSEAPHPPARTAAVNLAHERLMIMGSPVAGPNNQFTPTVPLRFT